MKKTLHSLHLHDKWRTLNPNTKDYTYYSPIHNNYSRIDHIFLLQADLHSLTSATIHPMILSDHHPITGTLTLPDRNPTTKTWRLNPTLLGYVVRVQTLKEKLTECFHHNNGSVPSQLTSWEPHKCVIRGDMISMQSNLKKTSQLKVRTLIDKIRP